MVDGKSETILITTAIFVTISLIAVCLRCFVRIRITRAFGWDDGFMVFAMVLNIFFAACGIIGACYGFGKRMTYFIPNREEDLKVALLCWWLGQIAYVFTCVVAKISISITLLRITITRFHNWILYTIIALTVSIGIVFFFVLALQCSPVAHFWERLDTKGTCMDTHTIVKIAYLYSVIAALCDFTIGILPIALVWPLHMNRKSKIALAFILGLGCVASSAVIVRIPYLHHYTDKDFLYATADISVWSNVEGSLGITAGSLTTLRPLFRALREGTLSLTPKSRTDQSRTAQKYGTTLSADQNKVHVRSSLRLSRGDAGQWRPDFELDPYQGNHSTTIFGRGHSTVINSSEEDLNPKDDLP
ncbi:hypothetical protein FQN54_004656 [Arachnomyces sp. PD_36]|nr:hypothetical protein FQN54_004656 [Arachnomyces sp. PD_36]